MSAGREPTRTLVVWCHDWPVIAAGVSASEPGVVLVANRVISATAAAREFGIRIGHRRREAQSRCPEVVVLNRDEVVEARSFEPIMQALDALTPRIEITRPGVAAFPTRGPSRYFGGDDALAERAENLVAEALGGRTSYRVGIADGPFVAGLAARRRVDGPMVVPVGGAADFLSPLPLSALERPELTDVVSRLGITTLGAFAALEAADVLARFGAEGRAAHRLACGLDEHPPDTRPPPLDLVCSTELDPPADQVETAAFVAMSLATELDENLAGRGLSCTRVAIEAETEHGESMLRLWRHEGALTAGAIADRVRWQLDAWLTGSAVSRPTSGISLLRLIPDEVVPARGRQLGFWGGETESAARAARILARVEAMLGPGTVRVPEMKGGRGLNDQFTLIPISLKPQLGLPSGEAVTGGGSASGVARRRSGVTGADSLSPHSGGGAPWPGQVPEPSPAMVCPELVPIEVADHSGASVKVTGRGELVGVPARVSFDSRTWIDVDGWTGPWTVDERWWDPETHRRYARFQVQLVDGTARLLILEAGRWWLEALYD